MSRPLLYGIAALFVLGLGAYWVHDHTVHAVQIANITASKDSLSRVLKASRDSTKAVLRQDSAHAASSVLWRSRALQASGKVDTLIIHATVVDSSFAAELPDSLKPGFRNIVALQDSIIRGLKLANDDLSHALAVSEQRPGPLLAQIQAITAQRDEAVKERDRALKLSQPSFLTRVIRSVPVAATFLAGGLVIGKLTGL